MKTGEDVGTMGLYSSECCLVEVVFEAGCFSRCPHCSALCEWELVDAAAA
jgi:pyruvate-formate lyase-activating enzyme